MFFGKIDENTVGSLKKALGVVSDLVEQGNFDVSEDGLYFQSMDSSHVCLVELFLGKAGFSDFRLEKDLTIGVRLDSLNRVLGCGVDSCALFQVGDDTLKITFDHSDFELKLIDIGTERVSIPEPDAPDAKLVMMSSKFQKLVKDMSLFGDTVDVRTRDGKIWFETEGDYGVARMSVETDDKAAVTISKVVDVGFALRYLNSFAKASGASETVDVLVFDEIPLCVIYGLGNHGWLKFWLAPKMKDDGDDE